MIDFRLLVKSGVHFGHQTSRWCPRMAPYIWGQKGGVHLIDVSKTAHRLEQAAQFLEKIAREGKSILWIGTKKPAQQAIKDAATICNMPSVTHRWIGGTLTNNLQVKKSITKFLHLGDVLKKAGDTQGTHYTKKELNSFQKRVDRLEKNVGGIVKMRFPVGAIVTVDVRKEMSAIKEAATMGIPIVSLVDTNSDPLLVDYVIPANDDAPKSIKILVDYLAEAAQKGKEIFEKERKEKIEKEQILLKEAKSKKDAPKKVTIAPKKEASKKVVTSQVVAKPAAAKVEAKPAAKPAPKVEAKPAPKKEAVKPAEKKEAAPKK